MAKATIYKRAFHYLTGAQDGISVDAERWFEYNIEDLCKTLWDAGIKPDKGTIIKEVQEGEWSGRIILHVEGRPRVRGVD